MSPRHRRRWIVGLFAAYLLLAVLVVTHSPVDAADQGLFHWTRSHRIEWLVLLCRAINIAFDPDNVVVVVAIVAGYAAIRRRSWRPLGETTLIMVLLGLIVEGSKIAIGRPGPGDLATRELQGAYPSGHTAAALVGASVLLILLRRDRQPWARWLVIGLLGLLLVTLIYAHFHFASDIVGSWLVGGALLLWLGPRLRQSVGGGRSAGG